MPLALKQPPASVKGGIRVFVADRGRGGDPLAVAGRLARGTRVLLRDHDAPDRAAFGRKLAAIARRRGLVLIVAGDARLMRELGAHGLHLPQWQLFRPPPRLARGQLLTAAVHDRRAMARARRIGVDAVLVSPVFATASHPGARPLGPHRLARLVAGAGLPAIALGGIDGLTVRRLPPGLAGIAAIGGFTDQKLRRVPR